MMEKRLFSAPIVCNLEITEACNIKCRHCYNYWREDTMGGTSLTKERLDELIDHLIDAGIFHVVLTGGEPMAKFDLLEHGFRRLRDANISVSCNSNLMLATDERIKRLVDVGVDHVLTSLTSYDPATNDIMVGKVGAYEKIISGIQTTVRNGMRVSVNMIVSQRNKDHVYATGKLVADLGCQKIFGTRTVPPVYRDVNQEAEFGITKEDAMHTLDQLLRVKEETGIMIGTLVSYPLCLLGDLERYHDFVGRGCPAQSRHMISINATGDTHACVHESDSYGNIFEDGVRNVYRRMVKWHDKSYRFPGCAGCDYIDICETGCRMSAHGYFGDHAANDQLMVGKHAFTRPYKFVQDDTVYDKIEAGARFTVPQRIRFRKENGFYLLNIRWANTIEVETQVAEFLIERQKRQDDFSLADFTIGDARLLAELLFKDAIESGDINSKDLRSKAGLSVNIAALHG